KFDADFLLLGQGRGPSRAPKALNTLRLWAGRLACQSAVRGPPGAGRGPSVKGRPARQTPSGFGKTTGIGCWRDRPGPITMPCGSPAPIVRRVGRGNPPQSTPPADRRLDRPPTCSPALLPKGPAPCDPALSSCPPPSPPRPRAVCSSLP